jgi:hypothetical protein
MEMGATPCILKDAAANGELIHVFGPKKLLLTWLAADEVDMGFFENSLTGRKIESALVDSEVTYILLSDGTQITIHGLVVVEPPRFALSEKAS